MAPSSSVQTTGCMQQERRTQARVTAREGHCSSLQCRIGQSWDERVGQGPERRHDRGSQKGHNRRDREELKLESRQGAWAEHSETIGTQLSSTVSGLCS